MEQGFIKLQNDQEIYYFEYGSEFLGKVPSVVFVHGNLHCSISWKDTMEVLRPLKRHLIAIDQRGFGRSTFKTKCNRIKDWAEDLRQFCEKRGIEKCIVNGWSFGSGVGMKLAEIAPELVTKLIITSGISHTGQVTIKDGKELKNADELMKDERIKMLAEIMDSKSWERLYQFLVQDKLFQYAKDYPREKIEAIAKASAGQKCYIEACEALRNTDIDISKVKAQGIVIHGKEDFVVPWERIQNTGKYFNNFQLWEHHGHLIPHQNLQKYYKTIAQFIEK